MAKYTVFKCDKCSKALIQENIPKGWMFAHLSVQENSRLLELMAPRLLWCEECLKDIKQPLPQTTKS
jgi:hypothetical protein